MAPALLGVMAGGTTMDVMSRLEEGKQAQELANARAALDLEKAKAAKEQSAEAARIQKERGQRLIEAQKAGYISGGVLTDVGAPLVLEAQTKADILKDIRFTLEEGREEERYYKGSASYEHAYGSMLRKRSKWDALSSGMRGYGSLAYLGLESGMFKKKPKKKVGFIDEEYGW